MPRRLDHFPGSQSPAELTISKGLRNSTPAQMGPLGLALLFRIIFVHPCKPIPHFSSVNDTVKLIR